MLEEIRGLMILQDRDRRLIALERDLAKLPQDEARAKTKLAGDTASMKKAHDELKAAELKVKKIEMDAETRRTSIMRLKKQQFETKKNDEYNAIAKEIVRYEKDVDDLETQELVAMEEVDALRKVEVAAKTALDRTQKLVDEDLESIKMRHESMKGQVGEVTVERDKLLGNVDEELLSVYGKLMKSKDGMAIASLKNHQCTGCHMRVIPSTAVAVQSEKEITQCENCGRILAMDE